MKRWLIAIGIFVVGLIVLLLSGLGLLIIIRSLFEAVIVLTALIGLAIWLSGRVVHWSCLKSDQHTIKIK